ncbi:peptidase [Mycobacterium colombiense]|uniref:Peptidase n=2 Tax=Mycobacterium TaxID=1763 RepID=A0A329LLT4_9MYCO|nr:peptidase [Mycobacterium intracellulare]RAV08002.1 peptidase [Mycobacterium colombiense]
MNSRLRGAVAAATAVSVVAMIAVAAAGCTTVIKGHGASMLYDPFHVGGLLAVDGPSGPRSDAPQPTGTVENTDHGDDDTLVLLSVNDIQSFWRSNYSKFFRGEFKPVDELVSYDSEDPASPAVCHHRTYKLINALFSPRCNLIAWDRGVLIPTGKTYFGSMPVTGIFAHEYGHAIQDMANIAPRGTSTIVLEQQADCFGGVYMRWVAEGKSTRFTLSTGDGLDHVLAGLITLRDPILTPDDRELIEEGHGTALDRVSAFQMGFVSGASACAAIDDNEVKQRRGDLPIALTYDQSGRLETGEVPITEQTLSSLMDTLGAIFALKSPPQLSYTAAGCADAQASPPASYCPATNTIAVDLAQLQKMGAPGNEQSGHVLVQGDDTAMSVVMSRYVLAVQHERGLKLDSPVSALRTACLTGLAHRKMAGPVSVPSGNALTLTAGDLDKAVAGLLTNHLVASDVNGQTVPAGFTRITAFRSGVVNSNDDLCYQRFTDA